MAIPGIPQKSIQFTRGNLEYIYFGISVLIGTHTAVSPFESGCRRNSRARRHYVLRDTIRTINKAAILPTPCDWCNHWNFETI